MSDTMTRKEALTALLDGIQSGQWTRRLTSLRNADLHYHNVDFVRAYSGSLDAALALHEAVLPVWIWRVNHSIEGWDVRLELPMNIKVQTAVSFDNPARAWLQAILQALIEQETSASQ